MKKNMEINIIFSACAEKVVGGLVFDEMDKGNC